MNRTQLFLILGPALVLAVGCATTPSAPPRVSYPAQPTPVRVPVPEVGPSAPPPVEASEISDGCEQVADALENGDLLPALDSFATLQSENGACPDELADRLVAAGDAVQAADDLARLGLERREAGDFEGAREHYRRALEIYPRYYWVRMLDRTAARLQAEALESPLQPPPAALESLVRAREAQAAGDAEAARDHLIFALASRPESPTLVAEVVEFARLLGLESFAAARLREARDLWSLAKDLDPGNEELAGYLAEVQRRLEQLARIRSGQ